MVSVYKNGSKVNAAIQLKEHYHEDIWFGHERPRSTLCALSNHAPF